ncbi:hypothetical protein [uncultured Muribaculum sp.]|uniref:hypothetical protein n=1 Tax=uncultured Muribaculum sp. TaxID=1918613 RepID=UPI0025B7A3B3|nr:hypothetical protein [uncultured Muribaculum sp.]
MADTLYRIVEATQNIARVMANCQGDTVVIKKNKNAVWVDIVYGIYSGAVLHLTIQSVDKYDLAADMAGRMQRIEMNIGGNKPQVVEVSNGKFEGIVVKAVSANVTPLQFLATDNKSVIVYGSFEMPEYYSKDVEMFLPVINSVENDIIKLISDLD